MSVSTTQGDVQALTFELDDQEYCVSITAVDEIVDYDQRVTTLPDTEPHVEGIVDLRGRTTTVVNPKAVLDSGDAGDADGDHIVVFENDDGDDANPVGWTVDSVRKVIGFDTEDVDEDVESSLTRGVVRNEDDGFIVWLDPGAF